MEKLYLIVKLFLALWCPVIVLGRMSVVLDKQTDLYRSWTIQGRYDYYSNGYQLEDIRRDRLPPDFDFKPFRMTKGIWVLLPDTFSNLLGQNYTDSNKDTTMNTTASISFMSSSQLMESVKVRYCIYGKARIFIKKGFQSIPSFTIAPSETINYEWIETNIPLFGSNRFIVETHVENPMDFVLLDRIDGYYSETTTSSTPRPSTSPRTHAPKSIGNSLDAKWRFEVGFVILAWTIMY